MRKYLGTGKNDVEPLTNGGTAILLPAFLLLENKNTCGVKGLKFTHTAQRKSKLKKNREN